VGVESHSSPLSGAEPFGNYYLVERIGIGGMAEVFLAVAVGVEGFQRSVVIKRILPQLLEDRAFVNMFIDEAKLCGVMSHPNIVQIFEFGKVRDSFFIAMEHVRGRTLSAVQARLNRIGGQAPIATSLEVMRQVCLGLDYAHGLRSAAGQPLGIVHRDVSPSNLMLGLHGGVKILDFGIARVAEELRETHTQVGTMKGKVSYMSPEQARLEPVDNRSDIFSVGIVLHELLTGHRLFKATSERSSTHLLQEMPVSPPSFANPEVAPEIDRIVMRALEHNPDARFQTAGEMASEIGQLLRDMRAPPDGPERLLESLFPHEPARSGEVDLALPFAPRFLGDSGSGPSRVSSARTSVGGTPQPSLELGSGASASAGRQYSARHAPPARRWWIVAAAVAVVAIAGAVVAYRLPPPHHRERAGAVAPAPAAAPPIAPLPIAAPGPIAAPAPVPAAVQVSLDSTPQDAEVAYVGSGEVVGRTPVTIAVPRGHVAVMFRFQKSGHEPIDYKVIPDLDKAVRVDLVATRVREEQRAPSPHRAPPARAIAVAKPRHVRAAAPAPDAARSVSQPHNCALSVGSFPWAELWIDGRDSGQRTPVVHYAVACGAHTLELRRPDLKLVRSVAVILAPDHELKQHYELDSNYSD
jgi:serine/threonine-protein kinase